MKNIIILQTLLLLVSFACTAQDTLFISPDNPEIEYWGRINSSQLDHVELYWSGTSIKMNFEGESIQALLKDELGDNHYNVIIDNKNITLLSPDSSKKYYQLATGLRPGRHSVEIFRRTEWSRGTTAFYGFRIDNKAKILPKAAPKKRRIEFYGNSITAGYAVEDTTGGDSPDSTYTNNYLSYAAITARNYDAQYHCICKGGIGITISWFPYTMPEIYDRLSPSDATSQWDFSSYSPDIVVINLFQNDSWLVNKPERKEFKTNFGKIVPKDEYFIHAYQDFISDIRMHYPQANIICVLGNMDATREGSRWPGYIEKAAANLNDKGIYTHFFPYKETPGHPSIKEQEEIANSLIQFIDQNIEW
jgi:hypothetical protein